MRDKIWKFAIRNHPEGVILTRWLMVLRAVLSPLDFFYWKIGKAQGYQWESNTWKINGFHYSGETLRALAKSQGEIYRITSTNGCLTLERLDKNTLAPIR